MTMQDPISDLLTRIRNAQMAGHDSVAIPNSKIKRGILEVRKILAEQMSVIHIATLYWPVPLFDIFAGRV